MNNFQHAKDLKEQASLVDLLEKLGFKPVKKTAKELMYHSMLRKSDTKPSFCVNDDIGVWFDHGLGKGGNIIDFGLLFWKQLSFNEVVDKIGEVIGSVAPVERTTRPRRESRPPVYTINTTKALGTNTAITAYLQKRGVFEMARGCMSEVYYTIEDDKGQRKDFFAAGWRNEAGGWEVRNKYFKGCLGQKAISMIPGHEKDLCVFEGYINYLSWKTENPASGQSVIVLNTLALLSHGIAKAKAFSSIEVYLDRDEPGYRATAEFMKALPYATDRSKAYLGFNDFNDKIVASRQEIKAAEEPENTKKKTLSL
jgi:hypothetical protein